MKPPQIGIGRLGLVTASLSKQSWVYVLPVFLTGILATSSGLTVLQNDMVVFWGMVLTGLGIVGMWIVEQGRPRLLTMTGPVLFTAGATLSAVALTFQPSNPMLMAGMILTGIGITGMWHVGKAGPLATWTAIIFTGGITIEAVGLTMVPSDITVMAGMVVTGCGIFGMWLYESKKVD